MSRWGRPIKNKKRSDPRYFLNEQQEEEERRDPSGDRASPEEGGPDAQLDEKEVLPLIQNFYKAMYEFRDGVRSSRKGYGENWVQKNAATMMKRAGDQEQNIKGWFFGVTGRGIYQAARAMAPVYADIRKGARGSANSIDVIAHHAGDMAEKFLKQTKGTKAKLQFLQQFDEITKEYFENTERFGKGHIL
tara:strand:+ start:1162 stop:1731 length:570 start_codon:yes stop_codon:yes gene_type:complete